MEETDIQSRSVLLAEKLIRVLHSDSCSLALAESCTGGLVADFLTRVPGASGVLWGSYVCYTPEAKVSMLNLDRERLARFGLVSRETVCDMAYGALERSGVNIAAAVTGLAGPDSDGSAAAVGTVWIAAAVKNKGIAAEREFHFAGSRNEIRLQAALAVLETLSETALTKKG